MKNIIDTNANRIFASIHPLDQINGDRREIKDLYFSTEEVRPYCNNTPFDLILVEDETVPEALMNYKKARF